MGEILPGPWNNQEKMSINPGLSEREYEGPTLLITEVQKELQKTGGPFTKDGDVLPVHCKNLLKTLDRLNDNVNQACQVISQVNTFTVVQSSSRYPLLTSLYTIQEQTEQLTDKLQTYRSRCLNPSHHLYRRRREIVEQLTKILHHLSAIPDIAQSSDEGQGYHSLFK